MSEWTKVIVHPMGLAGFALFLVFGYLARVRREKGPRWLPTAAISLAAVALLAGLALGWTQVNNDAHRDAKSKPEPKGPQATINCPQVKQESTGAGSPNFNCVAGDMTVTIDQSSKGTSPQSQPNKDADGVRK